MQSYSFIKMRQSDEYRALNLGLQKAQQTRIIFRSSQNITIPS